MTPDTMPWEFSVSAGIFLLALWASRPLITRLLRGHKE